MKIVLIDESSGAGELTFQQEVIKIGRNANECQISFARDKFPMVSRHHAEIHYRNNSWAVVDTNSSYGTFLNNSKLNPNEPSLIQLGSAIQFGVDGPVLIVILMETGGIAEQSSVASAPQPLATPSKPSTPQPVFATPVNQSLAQTPPINAPQSPLQTETPLLEMVGKSGIPPFQIKKEQIWLGRELNCDVVIEPGAAMVSRRHAQISRQNENFILTDNNSFNGTLLKGQRISTPTQLYHGDEIQLGMGGPIFKFVLPSKVAPKGSSLVGQRAVAESQNAVIANKAEQISPKTMVMKGESLVNKLVKPKDTQLLMSLKFGNKNELTIGRSENNDIRLDGLQISNRHARLQNSGGAIYVEDLSSTNGVYVNGKRTQRQVVNKSDSVQIGSFVIKIDENNTIGVFDTRSKTRIDCLKITKEVKNRAGGGKIKLLDDISLSIQPNEFIGLLGPSGAGKSTLMDAMNGMRPATGGSVLINNTDLYEHFDSLKQSIGYVPQDDIIHRELTVYRTLYYVAKLRLSRDVSGKEISEIINEVLDVTGLSERKDVPVSQLSGGQRKRVSIAVELITKPSIIYLDEPTSGLDPATEEKIMKLFRQIAESGRTVILTTHAMENVKLFDKIVILMRGKLVFYGKPDDALTHLGASNFKELYDKLEEPVEAEVKKFNESKRHEITERVAENWKQKFAKTPQFKANVYEPLKAIGKTQSDGVQKRRSLGLLGAVRQWGMLSRRYLEVLLRDKLTLFILFAQAPIIALLTYFVMDANRPRDFVYLVLALVSIWFGTSFASREIIRERPVYSRERMVNLGLLPYLSSKLFVLGVIVGIQCLLLYLPLKFFDLAGLMKMPGDYLGIPQLWTMFLTAGVGIAAGLFISALVKTSEMATSLVPLILIPQILFSGLVGVPTGISKVFGLTMPVTWSFDTIKRYSGLDTLEQEGAVSNGKTKGLGLYEFTKQENDKVIEEIKTDLEQYKKDSEEKVRIALATNQSPVLDNPPNTKDIVKIPKDLSSYISFLHPWMHEILNQFVLVIMFYFLIILTLLVLRYQDIG